MACQTLFAASTKIIDHGPVLEVHLVCEESWNRNRDRVRGSTVKDEMPSAAWEARECFMEQYIWVESSTWNPCSFWPPPISFTSTWSTFLLIYYTPETLTFFLLLEHAKLAPISVSGICPSSCWQFFSHIFHHLSCSVPPPRSSHPSPPQLT